MNEIRSAGNNNPSAVPPDILTQPEKEFSLKKTQQELDGLNDLVEVLSPEAQRVYDFLQANVFPHYELQETDKIKLVNDWHKEELESRDFFGDKEYDITSEGVEYFEAELRKTYETAGKLSAGLDDKEGANNNLELLQQLQTLQQDNNWSNIQLIAYALESGQIPESQVAKFETYHRLLAPGTISNEEDLTLISTSINGMDFMDLPDPVRFVQAEIYGNEAVSEATKSEIEDKLKIPRLQMVDTASEALDVLENGYLGSDGTKQEFTQHHPAVIDQYTYLYTAPDGFGVMDMALPDGRRYKVQFSKESTLNAINDRMYTVRMMTATECLALSQPVFQRGWATAQGGTIEINYDDIVKAKKVGQSLLGDVSGYDGRFMGPDEISQLKYKFQAFRKEGDWATGDNDPVRATRDFQELTIADSDGSINWPQFERACNFIQTQSSQGILPTFENLKTYLTDNSFGRSCPLINGHRLITSFIVLHKEKIILLPHGAKSLRL